MSNAVFTTEGHPLSLPLGLQVEAPAIRRALRRGEDQRCPAYAPANLNGLLVGIEQRTDWEYARGLIYGSTLEKGVAEEERRYWAHYGTCRAPQVPQHVGIDIQFGTRR